MRFRLVAVHCRWKIDTRGKEAWCEVEASIETEPRGAFFVQPEVNVLIPLLENKWTAVEKKDHEDCRLAELRCLLNGMNIDVSRFTELAGEFRS